MKQFKIYPVLALLSLLPWSSQAEEHQHHGHRDKTAAVASALNEDSIYNLHSQLLDENGKVLQLESFKGKPVVISMAYTSCAYTCPLILAQMQQLEKALAEKGKKDVRFILVSFDPDKDTPAVLKEYAKKKKLSAQWNLLTSKSDKEPREIASLLGIKYKKVEGGDYDHSFIITVLDAEGVPRGRQVGANADPKELMKHIP